MRGLAFSYRNRSGPLRLDKPLFVTMKMLSSSVVGFAEHLRSSLRNE
jgi:hypothetical protein